MHLTFKDLRKYVIFVIFFLWFIVFFHLFYIYLQSLWTQRAVRWWVFLEWVVWSPINPLPYMRNNYYSEYVRNLLYKSCLDDNLKEQLCSVKTSDNKTFIVGLSWDNYWKDGRKITLDDIYFTYNDIIKNNSLKLINPIPNNISTIKKNNDNIKITFAFPSVNNIEFFKNTILPKHILKWKTKDYYISGYLKNFVNSTCVNLDKKSDFINNIILNYDNCKDYYINSYQFLLLNNLQDVSQYLTWTNKIDIYNGNENISKNTFDKLSLKEDVRYAFFFNTLRQTNPVIKSYLASKILSWLKENISISNKVFFNGYGLFQLPKVNISKKELSKKIKDQILQSKKNNYKNSLKLITWDKIYYTYSWTNNFFIKDNSKKNIIIYWNIWTWKYEKLSVSANGNKEYFPHSYNWKTFKYIISPSFKNMKEWKNIYTLFSYNSGDKKELDKITIYYKKIIYPNFKIDIPEFKLVYLDKGIVKDLWDAISGMLSKYYPWKVDTKKVIRKEYEEILKSWDYDMVIWKIKFDGKDISPIFQTKDPLSNPSLFVNQNFTSLISQNLLASMNLKNKVFENLNKIYQEFIPMVFIGNKKLNIYVNKKYNIDKSLDYSSFENRKKMIKSIIINKISKPAWDKVSFSWFINFLKKNIN